MEPDVVRNVLSEVISLTDEHSNDEALVDLGLDSIAMLRVVVLLEQRIGHEIPNDRLTPQTFATVNALTAALNAAGKDFVKGNATDRHERRGTS